MRKEIQELGEKGVGGFGNKWITVGGEGVPIAGYYRVLKGGSRQGLSVGFRPLESLKDREAGVKQ